MTKDELLSNIRRDRARLDALVARVGEARLTEPALEGGWSVKDVLAHITAWEQRCLSWIRTGGERPEPSFTPEGIDAFNAKTYAENSDRRWRTSPPRPRARPPRCSARSRRSFVANMTAQPHAIPFDMDGTLVNE